MIKQEDNVAISVRQQCELLELNRSSLYYKRVEMDEEDLRLMNALDEEFTNFGQHYRFNCIPENEFWLENEATPDERRFFIDHLLLHVGSLLFFIHFFYYFQPSS